MPERKNFQKFPFSTTKKKFRNYIDSTRTKRLGMHLTNIALLLIILRFQIYQADLNCKHFINNQSAPINVSSTLFSREMNIFLDNVSLVCEKNEQMYESVSLEYYIKMYKGFEIRNSKLIKIYNYNRELNKLAFHIEFSFFQFYKQENNNLMKLLNESSSLDLLTNYHDLNNNLTNQNISDFYENFTSLFNTKYRSTVYFH